MNTDKETIPNNEAILNAINEMRTEMNARFEAVNARFDAVDARFEGVDARFEGVNARFEDMRLQMMSFDVRIDRIEALTHEVLNVAYNARADVKLLREEVHSWSNDVQKLQLKFV